MVKEGLMVEILALFVISIESGLPRVHGSALFTRGETQAIVATTLGTSRDEQMIDSVGVSILIALCYIITFLLFNW